MKKFIGDKTFYRMVLTIAVPMMIQNGVTNLVSFLDNIMIGQVGTEQMSGVAIVNQLIFVFNLSIFGIVSGASIFGTQFYGKRDFVGMRHAFQFKIIACLVATIASAALLFFFKDSLIALYLHSGNTGENLQLALQSGQEFLTIMILGLFPFAISQVYASTIREMGKTVVPMFASSIGVVTNTVLNYLLIFGHFGAPVLGVRGAAIATVIARFVECFIIVYWVHRHNTENPFVIGAFRQWRLPKKLVLQIIKTGAPLMANEILWASGMTIILQAYSVRGLTVIAGINIASTISNIFNILFLALGGATAVIVGQLLGANKMEEAKDSARKIIFFSVASCFVIGVLMFAIAPMFPSIYNTSEEVKTLASSFIRVAAICMPIYAFNHASYFVLRSGGKTMITFLFDSVFIWVIILPLAFFLSTHTQLPIVTVYFICQFVEIIKSIIGYFLVRSSAWLENIVVENEATET
uniref:MATE family efflux transporter n=1 Tax=Candidatus Enterococcus willemsii TaxID=1857215 RepID=UPI00403FA1A6